MQDKRSKKISFWFESISRNIFKVNFSFFFPQSKYSKCTVHYFVETREIRCHGNFFSSNQLRVKLICKKLISRNFCEKMVAKKFRTVISILCTPHTIRKVLIFSVKSTSFSQFWSIFCFVNKLLLRKSNMYLVNFNSIKSFAAQNRTFGV